MLCFQRYMLTKCTEVCPANAPDEILNCIFLPLMKKISHEGKTEQTTTRITALDIIFSAPLSCLEN